MHVAGACALGLEENTPKRGPSLRPLGLVVKKSMATFDLPETGSERVKGSAECVNEMAKQRVGVSSGGHRG
jgi:hypothetical protein